MGQIEFWLESDRFSLSLCRGRISEPDCFLFAHFLYGVNRSAISLSLTLIRKKISTVLRGVLNVLSWVCLYTGYSFDTCWI